MKNLHATILSFVFILINAFVNAQPQDIIILEDSKNLKGTTGIVCHLNGEVETSTWNNDYVRIVTEITTDSVTKEVVKHLINKNRFKIGVEPADSRTLHLINPNIISPVYINGRQLEEVITYKIFVPHNTIVYVQTDEKGPLQVAVSMSK